MMQKNILLADDEKEFCDFFKNYFLRKKYMIDVAYDGSEAKGLLENKIYNYIFFDCNMPELSGVELIKVMKEKNPEAKKIMISGYNLISEDFAKNLGIDVFLPKPFALEDAEKIIVGG